MLKGESGTYIWQREESDTLQLRVPHARSVTDEDIHQLGDRHRHKKK